MTATPKRIGAALRLTLEDVASVGQANFENLLRQHLSLVLSDELDDQLLNGSGTAPNLAGILANASIESAAAPAAGVESWSRFLAAQAAAVDGLWASELGHVGLLVGPETYRLSATVFQGSDSEESAAMYLKRTGAGESAYWTNSRMPVTASNIQAALICRKGRSTMQTAVAPTWGYVSVDDIFSGAGKGERRFVLNTLVGDCIVVQAGAYRKVSFRVSA